MLKKKFSIPMAIGVIFSLCFIVTFVWAQDANNGQNGNSGNNGNIPNDNSPAQAITLQDQFQFIGEHQGNDISDTHLVNVETDIWAFTTNNGKEQLRIAPGDITLTVVIQDPDGHQVGDTYTIVIKNGESFGSTKLIFPRSGQFKLNASGTINNDGNGNGNDPHSEEVNYTTNLFWVYSPVDHFGFVDSTGAAITNPYLNLRPDVNSPSSNWAYIGEPMQIDVYLKAYTKDGVPINNYIWDGEWFSNLNNWNITSSSSSIDRSLLDISVTNSILHALIQIKVNDNNVEQVIRDYSVTIKPTSSSGISTPLATPAVVPTIQGTKYTLYGGQIRIAQSFFYEVNGMGQVYVEKYDGGFLQNKDDSQTAVSAWDLSGAAVSTPDFKFSAGSGQVSVSSDASNVSKTLSPIGFPSYLRPVPGTLTWGQIVNNPPPQQNEGTVWERELPP